MKLSTKKPAVPQAADRLLLIAKLGAFALFLSTIEYMIPKPVHFMRIGLANVPIMLSLALLSPSGYILLVVLKVAGQALVNGTLFSYIFLFSLGGTAASSLVMFLLYHLFRKYVSYVGISMAGALASNAIQLVLAGLLMFGSSAKLIAPPFLIMGILTAIVLGLFTQRFTSASQWFQQHLNSSEVSVPGYRKHAGAAEQTASLDASFSNTTAKKADLRLITGLLVLPAFLLQPALSGVLVLAAAAVISAAAAGKKIKPLPGFLLLISVVLANLLQRNGLVLFSVGGFPVTAGALRIGLDKAFTLIGLIYLSQFMISRRPRLPGRFGRIISLQLYYFEQITEKWRTIKKGGITARLDALLYQLEAANFTDQYALSEAPDKRQGTSTAGRILCFLFAAASWALLALGYAQLLPQITWQLS